VRNVATVYSICGIFMQSIAAIGHW